MKIRSLLLGSAALAGLTTVGYAADLGVVTSLDVCDELGLSGLTISSDEIVRPERPSSSQTSSDVTTPRSAA